MPSHLIRFRDGTVIEQEEPPMETTASTVVYLDGEIRPVGEALARLMAERGRLVVELDKAKTALADLRGGVGFNDQP